MELFRHPVALIWLAAGFLVLLLFRFKAEESRGEAARLVLGPSYDKFAAGPEAARRRLRGILYFAALALLCAAAAGPQWGVELSPVTDLKGNIVVAVDTSLSMAARDLKPDRLANARLLLGAVAEKFADYRVGVVAFAGDAYVQCPLTTDQDAITYFASALKPGMLPSQGTDFSAAIGTTLGMLARYGGQKVMVLVTDGEDHSASMLEQALKAAQEQDLKIYTVGIGTPDGELVPMTDSAGNTMEYKKDREGKTVVTRLGEATLMKIAARTGAAYLRYTGPEAAAEAVRSSVASLDLQKSKARGRAGYKDRYQWPLALALVLLLIELLVMEKGFSIGFRPRVPAMRVPWKNGAAALLALLLAAGAARAEGTGAEARKGNSAYGKGDWQKAAEHYSRALARSPGDRRLNFNTGAAYYRQEEYDKAAEAFDLAASTPTKIAARARYNKGNALYRKGDFSGAIAAYRGALAADPADENAKFNLQKALEQKKKNSCDNPRENEDKKDQEKKDQDKQDQKKGGGGDKDKGGQDEQKKKQEQARQRARQILEMMKEKEKEAARSTEAMRQAALRQGKPEPQNRLEDW